MKLHYFLIDVLTLLDLHSLENHSAETTHTLTPQKMLLGWQEVPYEYFVSFFALVVG